MEAVSGSDIATLAAIIAGYGLAANEGVEMWKRAANGIGRTVAPWAAQLLCIAIAAGLAAVTMQAGAYPLSVWVGGIAWAATSGPLAHDFKNRVKPA